MQNGSRDSGARSARWRLASSRRSIRRSTDHVRPTCLVFLMCCLKRPRGAEKLSTDDAAGSSRDSAVLVLVSIATIE